MWRWDEEEEILIDGRGNRREGEQREGLRGKGGEGG